MTVLKQVENKVIGYALYYGSQVCRQMLQHGVTVDYFTPDGNLNLCREAWQEIERLLDNDVAFDGPTVARNLVAKHGEADYYTVLSGLVGAESQKIANDEAQAFADIKAAIDTLKSAYTRRAIQQSVNTLADAVANFDGTDVAALRQRILDAGDGLGRIVVEHDGVQATDVSTFAYRDQFFDDLQRRQHFYNANQYPENAVGNFGIDEIDELIGWFLRKTIGIIAGGPGSGKTRLASHIITRLSCQLPQGHKASGTGNQKGLVISLELPTELMMAAIMTRYVKGISMRSIYEGSLSDQNLHDLRAAWTYAQPNLLIIDRNDFTASSLDAIIKYHVDHFDISYVVLDYIQLLQTDNPNDSDVRKVQTASMVFTEACKQHGVFGLLLSQLSRDKTRAVMNRLKNSSQLEQDAYWILGLSPDTEIAMTDETMVTNWELPKNRLGRRGDGKLLFNGVTGEYETYRDVSVDVPTY